MYYNYYK